MRTLVGVFLLAGLLGGLPGHSFGQDDLQFGVTVGGNWVTMESPGAATEGYFTFSGGVVARQTVVGGVSLQSELVLNQRGVDIAADSAGSIEYGAVYLQLPLLLHLEAPALRSVVFHAEAGGYGAVKLFGRQTPGNDLNVSLDTGTSFFQRFDAGIVAGGGASFSVAGQPFNVTVRREWGLPDVARNVQSQDFEDAPFPSEGKIRAWAVLLRIGL
jgi:hypothetical protein